MFKKGIKFIVAVLAIIAIQRFCHIQTDGFAISKVSSALSYKKEWESLPPSDETQAILKQKYTYLARGAQCFVFESEDKNYVLKFFRHSRMRPPVWLTLIPFPGSLEKIRLEKVDRRNSKVYKDFASYKIAFEEMKEATGLLYLHLNKTSNLHGKTTIVDNLNIAHAIDLDKMEFLVQKRADLVYPTLQGLIEAGKLDEAKKAITSLVNLLKFRCKQGIFDKDPDLNTNYGFYQGEALQIDIGRFKKDPSRASVEVYRDDLIRITDNLRQWLDERSPELSKHLNQEIHAL